MGENELTEWDDLNNEMNVDRRKIDLAGLMSAFDGRFVIVREDKRRDYGERRFNMLVAVDDIVFNITCTPRGRRQRIISARLADRKERSFYHAQRQIR